MAFPEELSKSDLSSSIKSLEWLHNSNSSHRAFLFSPSFCNTTEMCVPARYHSASHKIADNYQIRMIKVQYQQQWLVGLEHWLVYPYFHCIAFRNAARTSTTFAITGHRQLMLQTIRLKVPVHCGCYADFDPSYELDSLSLNFAIPGNWLE